MTKPLEEIFYRLKAEKLFKTIECELLLKSAEFEGPSRDYADYVTKQVDFDEACLVAIEAALVDTFFLGWNKGIEGAAQILPALEATSIRNLLVMQTPTHLDKKSDDV